MSSKLSQQTRGVSLAKQVHAEVQAMGCTSIIACQICLAYCSSSQRQIFYSSTNNSYCLIVQHLLERHVLDVMHCEKNLCENIVKTLWGMNDSPTSRIDAHELGIREEIWLQESRRQQDEYYMP